MRHAQCFVILLVVLAAALPVFSQTAADHIVKGDAYSAKFDREKALAEYEKAIELDPANYTAMWKASAELSFIGNDLERTEDKDVIEGKYAQSVKYADMAIAQNENSADAHFYMAVAKGRLGLYRGKKEMIALSKDVKFHGEKTIELDPSYFRAYYLMGRWHDKIANVNWMLRQFAKIIYGGLPDASNEEALRNYKKAIELNPEYIECHKELGRFYMDRKNWSEAVKVLERCLELPEAEGGDRGFKGEAAILLNKARKKL